MLQAGNVKELVRSHKGLWGYGIFAQKIIGIRDTEGKNNWNTGYLKKKYGDIQREV